MYSIWNAMDDQAKMETKFNRNSICIYYSRFFFLSFSFKTHQKPTTKIRRSHLNTMNETKELTRCHSYSRRIHHLRTIHGVCAGHMNDIHLMHLIQVHPSTQLFFPDHKRAIMICQLIHSRLDQVSKMQCL